MVISLGKRRRISLGVNIEFQGHQRDGWHVHIFSKAIKEIQNNSHHRHMVTKTPNPGESINNCDHVTVVTVKSEKKKQPAKYTCSSAEEDLL